MDYEIYQVLPQWVLNIVDKLLCNNCKKQISSEDIIATGIRKISENKHVIFIEYQCKHCLFRQVVAMDNKISNIQGLCFVLLDNIRKIRLLENAFRRKRTKPQKLGKISDKEVNDFIKFVNKSKNYDEFLQHIGVKKQRKKKKC